MRYNLLNILTVMMLVVGWEQLLGRQHLNVLLLSFVLLTRVGGEGVNPGAERIKYDII